MLGLAVTGFGITFIRPGGGLLWVPYYVGVILMSLSGTGFIWTFPWFQRSEYYRLLGFLIVVSASVLIGVVIRPAEIHQGKVRSIESGLGPLVIKNVSVVPMPNGDEKHVTLYAGFTFENDGDGASISNQVAYVFRPAHDTRSEEVVFARELRKKEKLAKSSITNTIYPDMSYSLPIPGPAITQEQLQEFNAQKYVFFFGALFTVESSGATKQIEECFFNRGHTKGIMICPNT